MFDPTVLKHECITHIITEYADIQPATVAKMIVRFSDAFDSMVKYATLIEENRLWQLINDGLTTDNIEDQLGIEYYPTYNVLYKLIKRLERSADKMLNAGCCPIDTIQSYTDRFYLYHYYA